MSRTGALLAIVVTVLVASCIQADLIECTDGRACPSGTLCDDVHHGCVNADQFTSCDGVDDFTSCPAITDGRCFDGVCLTGGCGNGFVEPEELCDDSNIVSGDGCANDCRSQERCGDGYVDRGRGEECDDRNTSSRDGCGPGCTQEEIEWRALVSAPTLHSGSAIAYDEARGRLVLFGGSDTDGSIYFDDTYEWNGHAWSRMHPGLSPEPRAGAAMAYDPVRKRIVMVGGFSSEGFFADTWDWDGARWQRALVTQTPTPRAGAALAWDPGSNKLVMFGGSRLYSTIADTWTWDGVRWELVTTEGPPTRVNAAFISDPVQQRLVLVGGSTGNDIPYDTWVFKQGAWTLHPATIPSDVDWLSGIYDSENQRIRLVAHSVTNGSVTYDLVGEAWQVAGSTTNGAFPTLGFTAAFDTKRRTTLVYGGQSSSGNLMNVLWLHSPTIHTSVFGDSGPPGRTGGAMASDPERGVVMLFSGRVSPLGGGSTVVDETWEWNGEMWKRLFPTTRPSARELHATSWFPPLHSIVMVGGRNGTGLRNDTWRYDATGWTELPIAGPPARIDAALAYDSVRRELVLFGGENATGVLADTWTFDGTAWTQRMPATSPPARRHGQMANDPLRGRITLFGGDTNLMLLGDTWEWDGMNWIERVTMPSPEARNGHLVLYNTARSRTWVCGGSAFDATTWEWDGTSWTQPPLGERPLFTLGMLGTYDDVRREAVLVGGLSPLGAINGTWLGAFRGDADELCSSGLDYDEDGTIGCADLDCAPRCATCGDSVCGLLEDRGLCSADCP